jgi:hypothetical protein
MARQIGYRLAQERNHHGLTQAQLAGCSSVGRNVHLGADVELELIETVTGTGPDGGNPRIRPGGLAASASDERSASTVLRRWVSGLAGPPGLRPAPTPISTRPPEIWSAARNSRTIRSGRWPARPARRTE